MGKIRDKTKQNSSKEEMLLPDHYKGTGSTVVILKKKML